MHSNFELEFIYASITTVEAKCNFSIYKNIRTQQTNKLVTSSYINN